MRLGPRLAVVSLNGNGYVFDQDFNILSFGCGFWGCGTLTKTNPGPGQFELPHDITVDRQERVYVLDRPNGRCEIFNNRGEYQTEWRGFLEPSDLWGAERLFFHAAPHDPTGEAPETWHLPEGWE